MSIARVLSVAFAIAALVAALRGTAYADAVPAELVGAWKMSSVSDTDYGDASTGTYSAPSGYRRRLTIAADGRYDDAELRQVSSYQCQTGYFGHDTGIVRFEGHAALFLASGGTLRQWATCSGKDTTKSVPPDTLNATVSWSIENAAGTLRLVFRTRDGRIWGAFVKE